MGVVFIPSSAARSPIGLSSDLLTHRSPLKKPSIVAFKADYSSSDSASLMRSGGGGGGTPTKDTLGNDAVAAEWIKTHGAGDRTLTQGLKGDPTYLVVENDKTLATYGINAVLDLEIKKRD